MKNPFCKILCDDHNIVKVYYEKGKTDRKRQTPLERRYRDSESTATYKSLVNWTTGDDGTHVRADSVYDYNNCFGDR